MSSSGRGAALRPRSTVEEDEEEGYESVGEWIGRQGKLTSVEAFVGSAYRTRAPAAVDNKKDFWVGRRPVFLFLHAVGTYEESLYHREVTRSGVHLVVVSL